MRIDRRPSPPPVPPLDPATPLSEHYTVADLMRSETAERRGIDNTPDDSLLPNLRRLAEGLEQIARRLGAPPGVSSAYRCPELNVAVGGAERSQHCQGLAADIVCPSFGSPAEIAVAIAGSGIDFDTVILEFGEWVHVSFTAEPRRRLLSIHDSRQGYLDGLVDRDGNTLFA